MRSRVIGFILTAFALVSRCDADLLKQSTAYSRMVYMQDSTQSRSPGVAGLTLTIAASKAGGAFATITPTYIDRGGGWYSLALTTAHTDTLGTFAMKITATGVDETDSLDQIVAFDPGNATNLGLINLDAAVSSRSTYAGADPSGVTTLLTRIPGVVQPQTGDSFLRLGPPAGASHAADIAAVPASTWASGVRTLTSFTFQPTVGGYASGQDPASLVAGYVLESGTPNVTIAQMLRLIGAYSSGNVDGLNHLIKAVGNSSITRISYTPGANGSRSVTLTLGP